MGATLSKTLAKLKAEMKTLASTTGAVFQSIGDEDARAKLTSELAHPTPNDIFYTPPFIDPHTNRANFDTTPRYVPYDSALLTHGCSGRNITWQYLHAANGNVPYPYDKCLGVERLLQDHGCNMGACVPSISDLEFPRYAFYDWDGLGGPVAQDVVVDTTGGERKIFVHVDDDSEEEEEEALKLKPMDSRQRSKRGVQLPKLSAPRGNRYGARRGRPYRERISDMQRDLLYTSPERNEHALLSPVHPTTPSELDEALPSSDADADLDGKAQMPLKIGGKTQESGYMHGTRPTQPLDLPGSERGHLRCDGYMARTKPAYEIVGSDSDSPPTPQSPGCLPALDTSTLAVSASPHSAHTRQTLHPTTSPSPSTLHDGLTVPSRAGRAGAGILVLALLILGLIVHYRAAARRRRRFWSKLNTSMFRGANGTRVSVTGGGGSGDDAEATALSDFSSVQAGAARFGIGELRGLKSYRDVVVAVAVAVAADIETDADDQEGNRGMV